MGRLMIHGYHHLAMILMVYRVLLFGIPWSTPQTSSDGFKIRRWEGFIIVDHRIENTLGTQQLSTFVFKLLTWPLKFRNTTLSATVDGVTFIRTSKAQLAVTSTAHEPFQGTNCQVSPVILKKSPFSTLLGADPCSSPKRFHRFLDWYNDPLENLNVASV